MPDFIKFLGTAGARVVLSRQLRASGGIWISLDDTNIYIDPGPGALVHCLKSRPILDPVNLDAILLSHKHLDHSGDINVMIEAMTSATYKKKGIVLAPSDALLGDPVILKYVRRFPEKIEKISVGKSYKIKNLKIISPIKHIHHGTKTHGFRIKGKKFTISYISDTKFFKGLIKAYKNSDILIINVMLPYEMPNIEHLNLNEACEIIKGIKPKCAILTHFGIRMISAKPWEIAKTLSKKLNLRVIAAYDGLKLNI